MAEPVTSPALLVRRGRELFLLFAAAMVAMEVATGLAYAVAVAEGDYQQKVFRLLLTVGLFSWLYTGSRIARWITVALFSLGLLGAAIAAYSAGLVARVYAVANCSLYAIFIYVLLRNPSVVAFLTRNRSPIADPAESGS